MLHKWLKAGYMETHTFHPTEEGVPQGGIISPVIANMALDGLEEFLRENELTHVTSDRTGVVDIEGNVHSLFEGE